MHDIILNFEIFVNLILKPVLEIFSEIIQLPVTYIGLIYLFIKLEINFNSSTNVHGQLAA